MVRNVKIARVNYANSMKKNSRHIQKEIDAQLRQASSLRFTNPRQALCLLKEALNAANAIEDPRRTAKTHVALATLHYDRGELDMLEKHCHNAMQLAPEDFTLCGDCKVLLGLAQWQKGNHACALEHYLSAIHLWKQAKMSDEPFRDRNIKAFVNIGHLYTETGDYEKALDYYFKALSLLNEETDAHTRSTIQRSIGSVYEYLHEFERAIEFFRHSLHIVKETKDAIGESVTRYNLGNTLWLKGCLNESLIELEHAADLAKATGDKRVEVASLVIQAAVYAELNKRDEFERLTSTLLETVDALGIADMQVKSREILAKSHLKLNQPQKALPLFEEELRFRRNSPFKPQRQKPCKNFQSITRVWETSSKHLYASKEPLRY